MSSYRTSLNTMQRFKVDDRFYGEHNHCMCCVTPRSTFFKPPGLSAWTSLVVFFSAGVTYGFFDGADIWPYFVLLLKFCCEKHQIYNVLAKCPSRRFCFLFKTPGIQSYCGENTSYLIIKLMNCKLCN
jgi:hypothetical protein